ncbi:MAG: hypothetical protein QXO21_06355, partial [Candidatus Anstonellales archaeon]
PYTAISIEIEQQTKKLFYQIPFFNNKKINNQNNEDLKKQEENLIYNIKQLNQRTIQVIEGLTSIGLDAVQLKDEELLELLYNYYNPETIEKESVDI